MAQSPPEVLQNELERADTEDQFCAALQRAYDSIDQLHDRYVGLNWIHLDCRKNCFWCCYLRVDAKAHEILVLARHVQTAFTIQQRQALIGRLRQHAARVRKLSYKQHLATNVECPLLVDGSCSAYFVRPFGCRRHHSQRVEACEESFKHPTDLQSFGARDVGLFATMMKAQQTLHSVFAMLGYDNTGYELGTALVEALTDPECWRRWKEKKKTFRRAVTVPTHYNL